MIHHLSLSLLQRVYCLCGASLIFIRLFPASDYLLILCLFCYNRFQVWLFSRHRVRLRTHNNTAVRRWNVECIRNFFLYWGMLIKSTLLWVTWYSEKVGQWGDVLGLCRDLLLGWYLICLLGQAFSCSLLCYERCHFGALFLSQLFVSILWAPRRYGAIIGSLQFCLLMKLYIDVKGLSIL